MNKRNLFNTFLYIGSLILLCTGIYGSLLKGRGKNLKEVQTALLNPKYISQLNTIRIKYNSNELVLHKNNTGWFAQITATAQTTSDKAGKSFVFPADNQRVNNLTDIAGKIRKMYIVSDSGSDKSFFSRTEEIFSLEFSHTSKKNGDILSAFSNLQIKIPKCSTKTLHVVSDRPNNGQNDWQSKTVYSTEDDFSFFLNCNPSFWADGKLIPDCLRQGKNEDSVQKVIFTVIAPEHALPESVLTKKTILTGDTDFPQAVHKLFQARTANIVFAIPAKAKALAGFTAVFFDGSRASFSVYEDKTGYFALPAIPAANYALSLSAWTYESLTAVFQH